MGRSVRFLDELSEFELAALDPKALIQSVDPPPDFVDPAWLRAPDIGFRWTAPVVQPPRRKRIYSFIDDRAVPDLPHDAWIALLSQSGASGPTMRLAESLARYGDFRSGKHLRPANGTIARSLGVRRETVQRGIARLVRQGWLIRTGKGSKGVIEYARVTPGHELQGVLAA